MVSRILCSKLVLFFLCRSLERLPDILQFNEKQISEDEYSELPGWNMGNSAARIFPNPKFEPRKLLNKYSMPTLVDAGSSEDKIIPHQFDRENLENEDSMVPGLKTGSSQDREDKESEPKKPEKKDSVVPNLATGSSHDQIHSHQESTREKLPKNDPLLPGLDADSYEDKTFLNAESHVPKSSKSDFMQFIINHGSYDNGSKSVVVEIFATVTF